ncbi:MAG: hypothetical protein WD042_19640 [Phycisphaeraceae bacterium]
MFTMNRADILDDRIGRRRITLRRRLEDALVLACHLPAGDRLVLEQVYYHGLSPRDLGRLTGRPARQQRHHVASLLRRCRSRRFAFLAVHGDALDPLTRRVAQLSIFHGLTLRNVAHETGLSLHQVRLILQQVAALSRAEQARRHGDKMTR